MSNIPGLTELRESMSKRTKVTLVDRLKNVGQNLINNPRTVILPILTGLLVGASVHFGQETHKINQANINYSYAYNQMTPIKKLFDSDTNFYSKLPITSEALKPVLSYVQQGLTNTNGKAGIVVEDLVKKLQTTITNPASVGTNNLANTRSDLVTKIDAELTPLNNAETLPLLGSIAAGVFGVISFLFTLGAYDDARWNDINYNKKRLRQDYNDFIKSIKQSVKSNKFSEEGAKAIGQIFSSRDSEDVLSDFMSYTIRVFSSYLDNKNVDLFKVIAENPRAYIHNDLENIFGVYNDLMAYDHSVPLTKSRLKSRKDLFLKLLPENPKKVRNTLFAITTALDYESAGSPEYLESLINGTKNAHQLATALEFVQTGSDSDLPLKIRKKIGSYYVSHADSPSIPNGFLGNLRAYGTNKCNNLDIPDAMVLLSDIIDFRKQVPSCDDLICSLYPRVEYGEPAEGFDLALAVFRQNPAFAEHALVMKPNKQYKESCLSIFKAGILPTPYLYNRLETSPNPEKEIADWKKTQDEIRQGGFNPSDELKLNLEYTNYYLLAKSAGKSMRSDFSAYQALFAGEKNGSI